MQLTTFTWILIFAIGSAVVNTLGIFAIYKNKEWAEKTIAYFMCFTSGMLISAPLIFALPKAIKLNQYAGITALIGFLFMYLSNNLIKEKTKKKSLAFGIIAAEGIGIHSFVDGLIYTITFSVSTLMGFLSGLGLVIHEFAEGVIIFSVLTKSNMKKKKAIIYSFLVAALTTPIGALIAYPYINKLDSSILGLLLGFVSGVLIYVSASHLLPEASGYEKKHSIWIFLSGVLLSVFIVLLKMF